ncbi:MAG: metalloprotease RseP [Bacteroidetes bacterium]|jgi:hypothetical protein|nr:metalloprotease RseP [Bacteroidota bacterium]
MSFFSSTFFDFGVIIFLVTFLTDLIYLLLCFIWKIKVDEISVFFKIKAPLFRKEIAGVTYLLGWIPYGSYIRPIGMIDEDLEKIHAGDLPFTFLGTSKTKRFVFYLAPYVWWTLVFFLSCMFISPGEGLGKGLQLMQDFVVTVIDCACGKINKADCLLLIKGLLVGKNPVAFLLGFFMIINVVFTPLSKLMSWCIDERRKWPVKTAGFLLGALMMYFYVYKFMVLLFGMAGFGKGFAYLLSYSMGMYLVGTAIFFLMVFIAKIRSRSGAGNNI